MITMTPQTTEFAQLVSDVYGVSQPEPRPAPDDRQIYRETVQTIADRAKAAMDPALHGRIDKAMVLVLAGDVQLLPDGTAQVASQANGTTQYFVVNGTCTCKDFPKAPEGYCKHRLARAMQARVQQALALAKERLWEHAPREASYTRVPVPAAATLPEAPASVNCHVTIGGRQV